MQGTVVRMFVNASWLTGARGVGDILNLLLFIVLSRYYGPEGIGQYGYGLAIAALAFALVSMGLEDYAIRECSRLLLTDRGALIGKLVGIQLGGMACVFAIFLGLLLVTKPSIEKVMIILMLTTQQCAFALTRTLFSPSFARERMSGPAIAELLCRAGSLFSTFLLVVGLHVPLEIALIPFPLGGLALLSIATMSARHHLKISSLRITRHESFKIIQSAWAFAASVCLFYVYSRVNVIIVSFVLGDDKTGIYFSSLKFLETGVLPLTFIGLAAYPNLSRLCEQGGSSFSEAADRLVRVALVVGGLLTWALFYFVPTVIIPILGDKFAPASSVIKSMAVIGVLMALSIIMFRLLLAMHLQTQQVKISFWVVLLNVLLTVALLPVFDILGAVLASILSMIAINIIYLIMFQRKVGTTILNKTVALFLIIVLTAFLAGALFTLLTSYAWLPAAASLATFGALVLLTGFLPLPKGKKLRSFNGFSMNRPNRDKW